MQIKILKTVPLVESTSQLAIGYKHELHCYSPRSVPLPHQILRTDLGQLFAKKSKCIVIVKDLSDQFSTILSTLTCFLPTCILCFLRLCFTWNICPFWCFSFTDFCYLKLAYLYISLIMPSLPSTAKYQPCNVIFLLSWQAILSIRTVSTCLCTFSVNTQKAWRVTCVLCRIFLTG